MSKQNGLLGALRSGDVGLLRRMWGAWFPGSPQPETREEAELQFHAARTACESVEFKLRSHSHYWLLDHGHESLLPSDLRPKAEEFRPAIASSVGFSWGSGSKLLAPAKDEIEAAVGVRINEMAADGLLETDPEGVRREMMFAKNRKLFELFGSINSIKKELANG